MAATVSSIDNVLKEVWTSERVEEQLYQGNFVLERVKKLKNTGTGQQAQTTVHVGRNWGFTATSNAGSTALNSAGNQSYAQATWNYTHQHQQVQIDGAAIDQSDGSAKAIASVVDEEITGALNDLQRQLSRQVQGNGTGYVATCGTTSSSTDIVLNTADFDNAVERGWLAIGAVVSVGTSSDPVSVVDKKAITAISTTNKTITTATSGSTTSSNYVSLAGSRVGSTSYEMNGLGNIVSTSDLGGIAVASYPDWQAANADSTAQALTLSLAYQQNQKIQQKTGKPATFVLTGLKQGRKLYELAQAQVRFAGDSSLGVGNVDAVNIAGLNVVQDPDVKNECMYFLTLDDLLLVSQGEPYWQDKVTGGNRLEWKQGYDAFVGKLTTRMQLAARRRNSHAVLSGLS